MEIIISSEDFFGLKFCVADGVVICFISNSITLIHFKISHFSKIINISISYLKV